jgi:hypothetical protein
VVFSFIIASIESACVPRADPLLAMKRGLLMAWKPWYEQVAEMNNQHEREEFIKGVFGFRPTEKRPIVAGLILASTAAYVAGGIRTVSKAKKKK